MRLSIRVIPLLLPLLALGRARSDEPIRAAVSQPKAGLMVWDTRQQASEAITPLALGGTNQWTAISSNKTHDAFEGDAVLSNGRLVAVVRKQDAAVEVHAFQPTGIT